MSKPAAVTRVMDLYDRLRGSYWLLPGILLLLGILLAQLMLLLDRRLAPATVAAIPGIGVGSMDSARLILSTLAGSLISITALVFSLTIVALTLASSQFGPRLLRSFMRDRRTQTSLGVFAGTFLYCLLVLYGAESPRAGGRLPQLSVAMAINLGVLSVCLLVYFIHHVSTSIHVNEVLAVVSREFRDQIDRLFPADAEPDPGRAVDAKSHVDCVLGSRRDGYLRVVDESLLIAVAREHDLVLEILVRPGAFVLVGLPLLEVVGVESLDDALAQRLHSAFALGSQRTSVQDVDFNIDQLVEMALRALSPGVNDPRTAIACVHRLGQNLAVLARRPFPARGLRDDDGRLRLLRPRVTFDDLLQRAFVRIVEASRGDLGVRAAVREICERMAALDLPPARREVIENFLRLRLPEA